MFFRYLPLIFLSLVFSHSSYARQPCDWPFRTAVTIVQNDLDGVTDYPVDLILSASNLHNGYNWSTNGSDLRVFDEDDATPLNFNIAYWNQPGKSAEVRVSLPTLDKGTRTIYVYYGNNSAVNQSTTVPSLPFKDGKIRFHTRSNLGENPASADEARSIFNQGNDLDTAYGCSHPDFFTGVTNQNQGSGRDNGNFIAISKTRFTVDTAGHWGIRYGADFGLGGGLYIDKVNTLEEIWNPNGDFWWDSDWDSPYVLDGSIYLTAGEHELEIIGGEGCCDGGVTVEFSRNYTGVGDYNTATWLPFTSSNIDIRSEACPIPSLTITYGNHDVCSVDLSIPKKDYVIPTAWEQNVAQDITFRIRNEKSAALASGTPVQARVELPTDVTLSSFTGTDWSNCTQTANVVLCQYNTSIKKNKNSSTVTFSLLPGPNSATTSASISITAVARYYDSDSSNNTRTTAITINDNGVIAPVIPNCTVQPGIWARFFDTTNYSGNANYPEITNASDMQTFIDDNKTTNKLDGQTILSQINGTTNPFNDELSDPNDEYFLTIFEGYLNIPTTDDYSFDVDGDDAIEFWLGGSIITTFYGLHGTNGVPQNPKTLRLAAGYHAIEFRMQENTGGAVYQLFSREGGGNIRNTDITPASYFYHCAGDTNIEMSSQLEVVSDDINGNALAKAIPNAVIKYHVTGTNKGNISTDNNSTIITQEIDPNNELFVSDLNGPGEGPVHFIDGVSPRDSGLSYVYNASDGLNDSLWFSTDGITFTESTDISNDYNSAITHFQIRFDGSLKASMDATEPYFEFEYQVRVK